jgi:hypothetical protein
MRTALLALALLAAAPAAAETCAKYTEPLAFNACLARQGPAARAVHVRPAPAGRARARRAGAGVAATRARGRSEMVFKLGK